MRVAIALLPFKESPVTNRLYGKAGRVKAIADTDKALIGADFIDAIRDCLTNCILRPVMHQHRFGNLAPSFPRVFKIANQLFFFVSTLMMGSPVLPKSSRCSLIWSNCS